MRQFLFGIRQRKTVIDERNYVVVHYWQPTNFMFGGIGVTIGGIGMTIIDNGKKHYISYTFDTNIEQLIQDRLKAAKDGTILDQLKKECDGFAPYWVDTLENDCLIIGYLHSAGADLHLNPREILEVIKKKQFDSPMQPTRSVKLFSLDAKKMLYALNKYKNNEHKYASFAGHAHHAPGVHNDASLILFLLQEGGIADSTSSYSELLRDTGLILSVITSPFWAKTVLQALTMCFLSCFAGAAVGGAIDGYKDTGPHRRLFTTHKPKRFENYFVAVSVTMVGTLFSAVQALMLKTHAVLSRFTLPDNVLEIAMQAEQHERDNNARPIFAALGQ